ncbi:periplasmic component of a high-affinity zinc uptake system [Wigglesworthia glossinidia endosymbiont of Glossina morsitans morsitans (Yale colony)]|uniref:High-affinity zinc uptake system protein ZnuA n=1 Tax=Wigglesworthia glossinidia endosymbiont of Glossina morsitans morsitans (Yale colony) TaxID=1142511 RepID=H6Q4C3_WIGGL|nr:zinc ABC transporter substrate-binding protein ZnuA [Wigglesworthia glossinidia]AFA40983.1 periplasmic component of a high-affinity zinc uptake system [Wigglesworthia glossinidia endosymbiont of Glossina morsitans morsitans (Yale colony)]
MNFRKKKLLLISKYNFIYKNRYILVLIFFIFSKVSFSSIVTSIRPIGFIAAAIADGILPVEVLLSNNASPHTYHIKPSDILKIKKANILIWVGPELESFIVQASSLLLKEKQIIIAHYNEVIAFLIKNNTCLNINKKSELYNMHIWLSPEIAYVLSKIIYEKILYLIPNSKKQLDINLENFHNKLSQISTLIHKNLDSIKNKKYYVFHDAYSYFEKYFHLMPSGCFMMNPDVSIGAHTLNIIKKKIKTEKIDCIFIEPHMQSKKIISIINHANISIGILDPLGKDIPLDKDSYIKFLLKISNQYIYYLDRGNHE